MSSSTLPPPLGGTVKVVFDGVEGGTPAAQELLARHLGEIGNFHRKARQAQEMSETPGQHMQKALPGGGRLTYSFNQGQEVVRVKLHPREIAELVEPPKPTSTTRADPTLAIDVLFTNELYSAYDVSTITSKVVTPGGTRPSEEGEWDVQYFETEASIRAELAQEGSRVRNIVIQTRRVDYFRRKGLPPFVSSFDNLAPYYNFAGPIEGYDSFLLVTYEFDSSFGWQPQEQVRWHEFGDWQPGSGGGTYPPKTTYTYGRTQRDLFDVLIPAGAVGNPAPRKPTDKSYEAVALGRVGRKEDGRLVPCSELRNDKTCQRTFTITPGTPGTINSDGYAEGGTDPEADAPPFWFGQGFLALPHQPQVAGVPVEKTLIDIFIASSNNVELNDGPGSASRFDTVKTELANDIKVRVREFADAPPIAVRVDVRTEMLTRTYRSPIPDAAPTQQVSEIVTTSTPDRTATWFFAASPKWTDGGNEPAEPDRKDAEGADIMGKLLTESTFTAINEDDTPDTLTVATPDPEPTTLLQEPTWPGKVKAIDDRMTFLCRVEWTPPESPTGKGTARILTVRA